MKPILIFLFAIFLTNCTNQSEVVKTNETPANELKQELPTPSAEVNKQLTVETVIDEKLYKDSIKGAKGLIVLNEESKNPKDFIRFYNEDGSLWYEFTFYYDDSDGKFEYENSEFRPYAFHSDYFVLALKYIGEDSNRYKVIVNEETQLKKYVKKTDKNLKFETWEKHILKTFAVEFNEKENPLHETPNGKLKKNEFSKIDRFDAVEFKGEWLKVEWDIEPNPNNDSKKTDFGWIKWKKDEKLLINWFYFA